MEILIHSLSVGGGGRRRKRFWFLCSAVLDLLRSSLPLSSPSVCPLSLRELNCQCIRCCSHSKALR